MKKRDPVYLLLSILEGMLSGGYFYLAQREKQPLHLLNACVWLALSVFHGILGVQEEDHILTVEEEDYE